MHVSFAQSVLDICGTVNWCFSEFKVCFPLRYIFLANRDICLAPTMCSVSCPRCPWTCRALTDVRTGVPFGIWLAFRRNMGLHGLWYGLTVSLIYGSAVGVWLALKTDWNKEVEKVQKRLEQDKATWEANGTRNGEGEGARV